MLATAIGPALMFDEVSTAVLEGETKPEQV